MNGEYIKDFDAWNTYKKQLDSRKINFEFNEREIWWCALGVNVGSEQDGKDREFVRPVVIIRKINKDRAVVVPCTTKIVHGDDRIDIKIVGRDCQILLTQIRTVSSKRFLRKIQRVKDVTFQKIIINVCAYMLRSCLKGRNPAGWRGISGA